MEPNLSNTAAEKKEVSPVENVPSDQLFEIALPSAPSTNIGAHMSSNSTVNAVTSPAILGLEPKALWEQFDALSRIPRPSGHEEKVREHLRQIAATHGFEVREDKAGNILLAAPGKGLGVNAEILVIQAHMDMVCVQEPGLGVDFMKDAIKLRKEDRDFNGVTKSVLTGTGTTLGADNGLGLCAALAAALSPDVQNRPPLELLFTFDEERGLTGAKELDASIVKGRRLLNLDTEEHGCIYISCAGGRDIVSSWQVSRSTPAATDVPLRISLAGLPGGHSGAEIHEGRGNSHLMVLSALFSAGMATNDIKLASIEGGSKRNVIPSNTEVVVWVDQAKVEAVKQSLLDPTVRSRLENMVDAKYRNFSFDVETIQRTDALNPISSDDSRRIVGEILAMPNGVKSWSPVKNDLVESSNNVAVISTTNDTLEVCCMTRSSKDGAIQQIQDDMSRRLIASGATIKYEHESPGWEADPQNPLLTTAQSAFARVLGFTPHIKAIHAGLECGAFRKHIPDIKMISFGPDIREAHTTKECVILDTVPPFWECLKTLLDDLARENRKP